MEKKALIFCASSYTIDEKYNDAAREVVNALVKDGWNIVSGGTVKGTMGVVAQAVKDAGGHHKGVLPRFMAKYEFPGLDEVVWTDTMSQRKEEMRAGTQVAIALPGGIGTLDELFETLTLAKLEQYDGKVLAYNVDGFWNGLIAQLDDFVKDGMLDEHSRGLIAFPSNVGELMEDIGCQDRG